MRSNNSEGMGRRGRARECCCALSLLSSNSPLRPHTLCSKETRGPEPRRGPQENKEKAEFNFTVISHHVCAVRPFAVDAGVDRIALSFLEFESDVGVNNLHKSLSTDLQPESKSNYWWH